MSTRHVLGILVFLTLAAVFVGCSDSTGPVPDDGTNRIDPGDGSFVLKSTDAVLPGGRHVRLDLIGSDLVLDDDGVHIDLTVVLRNAGDFPLPGPAILWMGPFEPVSVFVANPDTSLPVGSIIPVDGYIYDDEFGGDGILEPGEMSAERLWRFRTPAQGSFSFGIRVVAGPGPDRPVIAGECFHDPNRNGVRDPNEGPLVPGHVVVSAPDSSRMEIAVAENGSYAYPLHVAGLHRVEYIPDFQTFAPIAYSTPNPRNVVITPGADGALQSFRDADFGAYTDIPQGPPSIQFTDASPDSLHRMPWEFLGAEIVRGKHLVYDVGFSGCGPDQQFQLWMTGGFMESNPVQVNVVLVHETEDACPAAWRREYPFDLTPLGQEFLGAYGPGVLVLNLIDYEGQVHKIEWMIGENPE